MEQKKRGRPKLHAEITEAWAPSRRQALNAKLFLGGLLKVEGNLSKGAEIRQLLCRSHTMINA